MTAPAPTEEFEFSRMLFVGVEWAETFNQVGFCGMAVGGGGGGVSEVGRELLAVPVLCRCHISADNF